MTVFFQISPLREAHYSFHDNWDKVMKLGDNLLQQKSNSQAPLVDLLCFFFLSFSSSIFVGFSSSIGPVINLKH